MIEPTWLLGKVVEVFPGGLYIHPLSPGDLRAGGLGEDGAGQLRSLLGPTLVLREEGAGMRALNEGPGLTGAASEALTWPLRRSLFRFMFEL